MQQIKTITAGFVVRYEEDSICVEGLRAKV